MDKVEKAKGVNHEIRNAYQSPSTHAGVSFKVADAPTYTPVKLFLVNYSGDSSPTSADHHTEGDYLIYQDYNGLLSFRPTGRIPPSRDMRPVRHADTCIFMYKHTGRHTHAKLCKHPHEAASSRVSLTGEEGWLDEGEKRHACDREMTMKSRQNEKSNWKTTGRVENSFSKLQR